MPTSSFRTGLLTNLLNPKIAVFYAALLPGLAPAEVDRTLAMAVLVAAHALLSAAWLLGYVAVLTRAQRFFRRAGVRRAMDRVTGLVLLGFAARLAVEKAP